LKRDPRIQTASKLRKLHRPTPLSCTFANKLVKIQAGKGLDSGHDALLPNLQDPHCQIGTKTMKKCCLTQTRYVMSKHTPRGERNCTTVLEGFPFSHLAKADAGYFDHNFIAERESWGRPSYHVIVSYRGGIRDNAISNANSRRIALLNLDQTRCHGF
jgi:hypothetical protein